MASLPTNPWEAYVLQNRYPDETEASSSTSTAESDQSSPVKSLVTNPDADPIIYPGLYCPSGFDMMSILLRVISRPNPKINLGPVDGSVALLLCDLSQPDTPIVYASDAFCDLTLYSKTEILGRNCRFLQVPPGSGSGVRSGQSRQYQHKDVLKNMRKAVEKNEEIQVELVNFKKNRERFVNLLSIIPVRWDGDKGYRYSVGFQVEVE